MNNNYILILISLLFLLFCYQTYQINCLKKEHFDAASDIKDAVKAVYKADIEAIRNLSSIASSLSSGNALTLPANITIPGTLNTKGAVTFDGDLIVKGNIIVEGSGTFKKSMTTPDAIVSNTLKLGEVAYLTPGKGGDNVWIRVLSDPTNTGSYCSGFAQKYLFTSTKDGVQGELRNLINDAQTTANNANNNANGKLWREGSYVKDNNGLVKNMGW